MRETAICMVRLGANDLCFWARTYARRLIGSNRNRGQAVAEVAGRIRETLATGGAQDRRRLHDVHRDLTALEDQARSLWQAGLLNVREARALHAVVAQIRPYLGILLAQAPTAVHGHPPTVPHVEPVPPA